MLRRCFGAAVVLAVLGGFVIAETYRGIVTSLDKDEVKVKVFKKGEKRGEEKTFKVGKDVKITLKGKTKDDEDKTLKIDDATKHVEKATTGKMKGAFATIETDGEGSKEHVTKITFGGFGKRPKKDSKKEGK